MLLIFDNISKVEIYNASWKAPQSLLTVINMVGHLTEQSSNPKLKAHWSENNFISLMQVLMLEVSDQMCQT